jgi:hypothetical protein
MKKHHKLVERPVEDGGGLAKAYSCIDAFT